MNKFKQQFLNVGVMVKSGISVVIGGAAGALSAHFTDPTAFAFDHAGIMRMKGVAAGGAAIALFHLFQTKPNNQK